MRGCVFSSAEEMWPSEVICVIPMLGIELLMIVRLLQMFDSVDMHQDGLGLRGCPVL